jgi:hypothetical protein
MLESWAVDLLPNAFRDTDDFDDPAPLQWSTPTKSRLTRRNAVSKRRTRRYAPIVAPAPRHPASSFEKVIGWCEGTDPRNTKRSKKWSPVKPKRVHHNL